MHKTLEGVDAQQQAMAHRERPATVRSVSLILPLATVVVEMILSDTDP